MDYVSEISCSPLEEKIVYAPSVNATYPIYSEYHDSKWEEMMRNYKIKSWDIIKKQEGDLGVFGVDPVWGPDGKWIFYTKFEGDQPNIYKVRPNGIEETLVERGLALSSFSESGKTVEVAPEIEGNFIYIDNKKTPFRGIEPFLIERLDALVYKTATGIHKGDLKGGKERPFSVRGAFVLSNMIVPTRGPCKDKVIVSDYEGDHQERYGIFVIDPETGVETPLLKPVSRGYH